MPFEIKLGGCPLSETLKAALGGMERAMARGPRYTPEQDEAMVIPQIVTVLYPIFYPVEQQDCAIQERNHAKVTEIATQAWRSFRGDQ